ncbi:MAG TPA: hypothetical protein VEX35_04215 [Allosphingosinicella sp.]|nr:hypothetical protein [Allosphingosinicella sp.]
MRRAALALALGLGLAAAPAGAQAPEILCSRNFAVGDMYGLIEQIQGPQAAGGPIRFALWGHDVRLEWWQVRPDAPSLDPPGWFTWEFQIPLSGPQTLWARYWADGVPVGRVLYLPASALSLTAARLGHTVRLDDPGILRRLLAAEVREVEIVGEDGVSLMRRRVPIVSPAALRAGFAEQIAWLAEARRTRPEPACHEVAEANYET